MNGSVNRKLELVTAVLTAVLAALMIFQSTPEQNYRTRLSIGSRFLKEENYEKAEAAFQEAIKIDDKKPEPYIGLGSSYAGQADVLLIRYQSGSKDRDQVENPTVVEKEKLEELYRKAQKAYRQASAMGSDDSRIIKNSISYVEQQKKAAANLRTEDDPEGTPTPAPKPENLNDLVNLEGGATTPLEENRTYQFADLDGDGAEDTMEIQVEKDSSENEIFSRVLINNETVLDYSSLRNQNGAIEKTNVIVFQMNTGDIYIVSYVTYMDDGDMSGEAVYQYRSGKLEKLIDLTPVDSTGFSYHDATEDFEAKGNTIQFHVRMMPAAVGAIVMTRTLLCHDGKIEFLSHEAEIANYFYYTDVAENGETDENPEFYAVKRDISCYESGNSQNISLTIKRGTKCKVTKAYFDSDMNLTRFQLETQDGRSGWFDQGIFVTTDLGTKSPVFYGHNYAG